MAITDPSLSPLDIGFELLGYSLDVESRSLSYLRVTLRVKRLFMLFLVYPQPHEI